MQTWFLSGYHDPAEDDRGSNFYEVNDVDNQTAVNFGGSTQNFVCYRQKNETGR